MKITGVKPVLLSYEYKKDEAWGWSGGSVQVWHTALVRVFTDEGIEGLGEMGTGHYIPEGAEAICRFLEQTLLGQDPMEIDVLFQKMYKLGANWGRRGLAMGVISGIENALWDIKGKALGVPVWNLLGGRYRKQIRAYASGGMEKPLPNLIEEIAHYLDRGFTAVKIRGGYDVRRDAAMCEGIRKELGFDFDLALDCGQGYVPFPWSARQARQVVDALAPYKLFFVEEPCRTDDLDVYSQITANSPLPIAGGENGCSIYEFKQLIDKRCVDIIQPDVTHAGGIGEVKRAAEYANLNGISVAPHVFRSGVSFAAHLHLLSAIPNALAFEYQQIANPLREELLNEKPVLKDGMLEAPCSPGLGVHIDDSIIRAFPYRPGTEQRFKVESI
ncbi:MAG: mandelate racemase/muconate lactonizing enzyme family protein [Eubacteriales bacterium]|nr:mandelate racemase/muconate lactonizing enzyme family protein [Eubacteriales bacterium]